MHAGDAFVASLLCALQATVTHWTTPIIRALWARIDGNHPNRLENKLATADGYIRINPSFPLVRPLFMSSPPHSVQRGRLRSITAGQRSG